MQQQEFSEVHRQDGHTKIARYKWSIIDAPGVLMEIPKGQLQVDYEYQRAIVKARIPKIRNEWSWVACGTLVVADRNNTFYIVDGQHRWAAAMERADIKTLPCLVFESNETAKEARGFVHINLNRKPPKSAEQFRTMLCAREESAVQLSSLISKYGYKVADGDGPKDVRCVAALLRWTRSDFERLNRVFPSIVAVAGNQQVTKTLVDGIIWIDKACGGIASDHRFVNRAASIGAEVLEAAVIRARTIAGTHVNAGRVMLDAINKGLRNKFISKDDNNE